MSINTQEAISSLRQRMIEDMQARQLSAATQRGHIHSCKRFVLAPYNWATKFVKLYEI